MQEDRRNRSADALKAMAEGGLDPGDDAAGQPVEAEETPSASDIAAGPDSPPPIAADEFVSAPPADVNQAMARRRREALLKSSARRRHTHHFRRTIIPLMLVVGGLLVVLAMVVTVMLVLDREGRIYIDADSAVLGRNGWLAAVLAFSLGVILLGGAWMFHRDVRRECEQ